MCASVKCCRERERYGRRLKITSDSGTLHQSPDVLYNLYTATWRAYYKQMYMRQGELCDFMRVYDVYVHVKVISM